VDEALDSEECPKMVETSKSNDAAEVSLCTVGTVVEVEFVAGESICVQL